MYVFFVCCQMEPQAATTTTTATTTAQPTPLMGYEPAKTVPRIVYWRSAEDEIIRRRKVRWGLLYIFLLDVILNPTCVILTFWVPAMVFVSFALVLWTDFLYFSVLRHSLRLSRKGKVLSGFGLFFSLLYLVPLLCLGVYSLLVFHRRNPYFDVVFSIIGSVCAYWFHFLFGFITVAMVFKHLGKPIKEVQEVRMETQRAP